MWISLVAPAPQVEQVLTAGTLLRSLLAAETGSSLWVLVQALLCRLVFSVSAWVQHRVHSASLWVFLRKAGLSSHPHTFIWSIYKRGPAWSYRWVSTCTFHWASVKLSDYSASLSHPSDLLKKTSTGLPRVSSFPFFLTICTPHFSLIMTSSVWSSLMQTWNVGF